jgi:hypothetical protein
MELKNALSHKCSPFPVSFQIPVSLCGQKQSSRRSRELKHAAAIRIFSYHLQAIEKADSIVFHESQTRQDAVRGKLLLRAPPEVHANAACLCVSAANTLNIRETIYKK